MKMYILMADIISSRRKNAKKLMEVFKSIIEHTNKRFAKELSSPLTITLGDEFQGLPKNCTAATEILFFLEEELVKAKLPFQLRYVLNYGEIETPVNKKIAYGMLGEGLTQTREALTALKNEKERRFQFLNLGAACKPLQDSFMVYQSIIENWKATDAAIITDFISGFNYREVASRNDKDPSLAWKRKRSLNINEYFAIKDVIKFLAQTC